MLVKAEGARFPLDHYLLTAVDRSSGYKMVHPFEVLPCKLNPDTCPSLTAFSYPPPPLPHPFSISFWDKSLGYFNLRMLFKLTVGFDSPDLIIPVNWCPGLRAAKWRT